MRTRGTITAIQTQKAHPDRVSLFVDDEFVIGIRREIAYHLHIRVGLPVTEEDLIFWSNEEARFDARELAIKYITHRARSSQQVMDYLLKKEFETGIIEQTLSDLEAYGYLNDQEYAAAFVQSRITSRPRGKRMIRWELQQKGIASETIGEVLTLYENEAEIAKELIDKKFPVQKIIQRNEELRDVTMKISRFLARKGFASSSIQNVLQEYKQSWNRERDNQNATVLDNDWH